MEAPCSLEIITLFRENKNEKLPTTTIMKKWTKISLSLISFYPPLHLLKTSKKNISTFQTIRSELLDKIIAYSCQSSLQNIGSAICVRIW